MPTMILDDNLLLSCLKGWCVLLFSELCVSCTETSVELAGGVVGEAQGDEIPDATSEIATAVREVRKDKPSLLLDAATK